MKALFAIAGLTLCQAAAAQMFKCTDATGKITYSSQTCAEMGLKDAGEVKDRLQITPAPPPMKRTAPPPTREPEVAAKPPAEEPAKPERRCFTTSVKGKSVTRCNDTPDEKAE